MKPYAITNQRDLRRAFWEAHKSTPTVSRHKIVRNGGDGYRYDTDTHCAFVDYIDMLCRDN